MAPLNLTKQAKFAVAFAQKQSTSSLRSSLRPFPRSIAARSHSTNTTSAAQVSAAQNTQSKQHTATPAISQSRNYSQAAAAMPHTTETQSLRLNNANLSELQNATVPTYDRTNVKHGIVHVGVGGFHRAHLAVYVDSLLEQLRLKDWAICGVGLQPFDAEMRNALAPQDNLYTVIERSAPGSKARVIGSITDYLFAPDNAEAVIAKMAHEDTHIVSMTITESGYFYNENTHELETEHPDIAADLAGASPPRTFFGFVYAALARRYEAGLKPFTVLSCDNMQKNGHITRDMLLTFAKHRDPDVAAWLAQNGAFPNSMVDRITPRTVEEDVHNLRDEFGVEDAWPVVTEPFMQWVVEDKFADGRPAFEKVGVQVVKDVKDVEQFELIKLRLLNASHSAMGYAGYLGGFQYIHETIGHPIFGKYIFNMMNEEVKPLLPTIPGVDVDQYIQTLIGRFSNPTLKDEITRICLGGSGKLPQFIMPSIAEQIIAGGPLRRLTLCAAAWFRYLRGVDEQGKDFSLSFDPRNDELQAIARGEGNPMKLLSIGDLFGDDLRNDKRFVEELTNAYNSLEREGAMKTLEKTA
ncbi:Mannitol 2-dehydrogenase [Ascochyta rabiei]|uniref:Mannitol 2-dehydrogenase n=1 Tax=Didymella rabiei TaxID=5454 RepID=A0A163L2T9_DIDRA|nr:Mannitol 2-dehydrogenase [Ascochyta rabiei]KZM27458.1 coenzyme binding [Ascochyta rabiei]UPX20497.1 Mannitol 2-dehydrogenase [Ascochyta rabiei]